MVGGHKARRFANLIIIFWKVLSKYLTYPLRFVRYLLQLSRWFYRSHTNEHSGRVTGSESRQPPIGVVSQGSGQLSSAPGGGSASNVVSILLPHSSPSPHTHASHARIQSPPASPSSHNIQSRKFEPFIPSEVKRYGKDPSIKRINKLDFIPPLTRDYSDIEDTGNWSARVHPEGALYFHDSKRYIYTDSNVQNQERRRRMDSFVNELLNQLPMANGLQQIAGDIELVVQLFRNQQRVPVCRYYFVDHSKRLVFWFHELPTGQLFDGVQGIEKLSHIKYAVEHQYWQHCELYPNENLPCPSLLKELKEIVVHASAETVTSDLSLSPFDGIELSKILELIGHLQENVGEKCEAHSICVIARFMRYFTRARFFNFYGLPVARLDADQSVYLKEKSSKLKFALSWAFNVALFGAPESHMSELRRVWVDRSINTPRWKNFNDKLSSEWSGITIYSTVMLAVDVSFLAVPSVNVQDSHSVPVISTYISVFCIVGSMVVSLFLTRQNRQYGQESADKAVEFLTQMTGSAFGTKAVATVHGLPYAMLLWGMVYFILAFSYLVFAFTSTLTIATTGSACGLVVLATLWLIYAARDFHFSVWFPMLVNSWRDRIGQAMRSRRTIGG